MKLVIFDLDQTLVDFISVHDEATLRLFRQFFGVDARLTEIDFAGRSLLDNFAELANQKGVSKERVRENARELVESYERFFGESLPEDAPKHILPGAKELLEALSQTDNLIALYTGDSEGIVKRVFQATGLGKYFKFSVYGTEAKSRADMVRLALDRAEKLAGKRFKDKDIVIIGDSIRDVECGKEFNALTIAVATGFHSREQLLATGPDYLFNSLEDYRKVLEAITSESVRAW